MTSQNSVNILEVLHDCKSSLNTVATTVFVFASSWPLRGMAMGFFLPKKPATEDDTDDHRLIHVEVAIAASIIRVQARIKPHVATCLHIVTRSPLTTIIATRLSLKTLKLARMALNSRLGLWRSGSIRHPTRILGTRIGLQGPRLIPILLLRLHVSLLVRCGCSSALLTSVCDVVAERHYWAAIFGWCCDAELDWRSRGLLVDW